MNTLIKFIYNVVVIFKLDSRAGREVTEKYVMKDFPLYRNSCRFIHLILDLSGAANEFWVFFSPLS